MPTHCDRALRGNVNYYAPKFASAPASSTKSHFSSSPPNSQIHSRNYVTHIPFFISFPPPPTPPPAADIFKAFAPFARLMTAARFELLEILSDVACDEASRLAYSSYLSPFPSRSTSTNLTSESPMPPYASAYIRDAPLRAAPISVVQVLSTQATPRFGGVRKPTRQGNAAAVAVVSGWKGRSTPSRFCHICSRTAKKVELLACANLASGACRKVVCEKCFTEYKWDWKAACRSRASWQCTHCRRVCPNRAQCAIYRRTNERRREQQQTSRARHLHNRSLEGSIPVPYSVLAPTRIAPGNNHY